MSRAWATPDCSAHACVMVSKKDEFVDIRSTFDKDCATFDEAEWRAFTDAMKSGVFDWENL